MRRTLFACGLAALACAAVTWSLVQADFTLDADSEAGEAIQTLTVRIDVGADGEALAEPLALDLGLGFPFWLHPLGRQESQPPPFGAVPQQTTAGAEVAAGASATFTFSVQGEPGGDALLATPQLLADVQVSDVSRIGFASPGAGNWVLGGYAIEINGRPFASNNAVNLKAQDTQNAARARLDELGLASVPLESERADLVALVEAQLAGDADQARLAALEEQLAPLTAEMLWLEGQLQGHYPWFVEAAFRSPWREDSSLGSVRVTLITNTHAGARTQNYVYFRTGGHKYLLGSPGEPMSGALGAQQFDVDLQACPLAAGDLRGYAVGMLAHPHPYDNAPDRWHPRRMLVEVDGRVVYDSDESAIDRNSLEAIRVIPPAHLDGDGQLVANTPTARETFLWEAGKGLGLDLVEGGALPLPPEDDPTFPEPEPGLEDKAGAPGGPEAGPAIPGVDPGIDGFDPGIGPGGDFPPGFDPFPGEAGGGGFFPDPIWPDWDPGWGPMPPWVDLVPWWLLPPFDPWDPGFDPPPFGDPLQIESVRITEVPIPGNPCNVEWTISGDESGVDHYVVSLVPVRPDQEPPFGGEIASVPAAAGQSDADVVMPAVMVAPPCYYVAPRVTAVMSDPADIPPPPRIGPARPIGSTVWRPQPQLSNMYVAINGAMFYFPPVSFTGEPAGSGRAVWTAGEVESHNAILFDHPEPAWNVAVRPEVGDTVRIKFSIPSFNGRARLIAYLGFLHGGGNSVEVDMRCSWRAAVGPPVHLYPVQTRSLLSPLGGPPEPMVLFEQVLDRVDGPPPADWAEVNVFFIFRDGTVDPAHPPTLFGVRVVPEP